MKRFAIATVLTLIAAALVPAMADPVLRQSVMVDADVVKLGDLFENLTEKTDTAVARAPAPGRRVTVDADWLSRIARAYNVPWKPSSGFEQSVIERAGVVITHEQIEQELRAALESQDLPRNSEIELTNRAIDVTVPIGSATSIGVRDLSFDKRSQRFTATIEVPANTANAQRTRISGRVYTVVDVPVLSHALNRGDVIAARDLTFVRQREDGLRRDVLTDADQLIGMSPKTPMRSGQMVSGNDLQKPVVVQRGGLVTMVLKFGTMTLTAQGRATEPGAIGDVIRVANSSSNQIVEAKVESANTVIVTPSGGGVLAN